MRDAIDRILAAEDEARNLKKDAQDSAAEEIKAARKKGKEYVQSTNELARREAARLIMDAGKEAEKQQKENREGARGEAEAMYKAAEKKVEKAVDVIVEGIVAGL